MIAFFVNSVGGIIMAVIIGIVALMVAWKLITLLWAVMSDVAGIIFAVIVVGLVIAFISLVL